MADRNLDDLYRQLFALDDQLQRISAQDRRPGDVDQWTFAQGAWQRYSAIETKRLAVVNEIAAYWNDSHHIGMGYGDARK